MRRPFLVIRIVDDDVFPLESRPVSFEEFRRKDSSQHAVSCPFRPRLILRRQINLSRKREQSFRWISGLHRSQKKRTALSSRFRLLKEGDNVLLIFFASNHQLTKKPATYTRGAAYIKKTLISALSIVASFFLALDLTLEFFFAAYHSSNSYLLSIGV